MRKSIIAIMSCLLAIAVCAENDEENKNKDKNKNKNVQGKVTTHKPVTNPNVQHFHTTKGPYLKTNQGKISGTQGQGVHNALKSTTTNKTLNKTITSYHPQHTGFHAQQNASIAAVKFNKNYKIKGSQNWQGKNYVVFKNYHPQWHNQGWWHSHYRNVILIGGGWYYWNAGYWYPAWGYDQAYSYYPYDGPIYVGQAVVPPDQVIADVQTALQQQGYYQGEVDGLLGPITREALANYQRDQGLYATETIDEPTLASLGLG